MNRKPTIVYDSTHSTFEDGTPPDRVRVVLAPEGAVVEVMSPDAMGEIGWHRTRNDALVRKAVLGMATELR